MAGFSAYGDHAVPIVMPVGASEPARKNGFSNLHELQPWQLIRLGDVTVTACPGLHHQVPEMTYVLEGHGLRVFFGADSLLIPALRELGERFGPFDLALLPCNGLIVRIKGNKQVVMNAQEAAELCTVLRPRYAVPIHYAFWGNTVEVAEGEMVVTHWTARGTHLGALHGIPASGRQVRVSALEMSRVAGNRIVEQWLLWDTLELLNQLDATDRAPAVSDRC
jgi:L-ascorbate metabolism protein UlaG (beta-lactamase superfamily)